MRVLLKYFVVLISILFHETSVPDDLILRTDGEGVYDLGRFGNAELSLVKFDRYRPVIRFLKYSKKVEVKLSSIPNRRKIDMSTASISVSKKENLVFLIFKCHRNREGAAAVKIRISDKNRSVKLEEVINGC